jgi:hypothetical protein
MYDEIDDRMQAVQNVAAGLTPAQQLLSDLWDEHVRGEFVTKDTAATLETMVPDAYVNHIPVLTGGVGRDQLKEFYSNHFIPKMPPDTEITPISRTIGSDRLVDELIVRFTHSNRNGLDASRHPSYRQACGMPNRCHRAIPRQQALQRAHLLGSGICAGAARTPRFFQASRCRSGNREKID